MKYFAKIIVLLFFLVNLAFTFKSKRFNNMATIEAKADGSDSLKSKFKFIYIKII